MANARVVILCLAENYLQFYKCPKVATVRLAFAGLYLNYCKIAMIGWKMSFLHNNFHLCVKTQCYIQRYKLVDKNMNNEINNVRITL